MVLREPPIRGRCILLGGSPSSVDSPLFRYSARPHVYHVATSSNDFAWAVNERQFSVEPRGLRFEAPKYFAAISIVVLRDEPWVATHVWLVKIIRHFTVGYLVSWSLNRSEAEVNFTFLWCDLHVKQYKVSPSLASLPRSGQLRSCSEFKFIATKSATPRRQHLWAVGHYKNRHVDHLVESVFQMASLRHITPDADSAVATPSVCEGYGKEKTSINNERKKKRQFRHL